MTDVGEISLPRWGTYYSPLPHGKWKHYLFKASIWKSKTYRNELCYKTWTLLTASPLLQLIPASCPRPRHPAHCSISLALLFPSSKTFASLSHILSLALSPALQFWSYIWQQVPFLCCPSSILMLYPTQLCKPQRLNSIFTACGVAVGARDTLAVSHTLKVLRSILADPSPTCQQRAASATTPLRSQDQWNDDAVFVELSLAHFKHPVFRVTEPQAHLLIT